MNRAARGRRPAAGRKRAWPRQGAPGAQQGVMLIAFILVVLTGASFVVLRSLNARPLTGYDVIATQRALNEARQALLGYAVAYPDRVNEAFGPGYLPCPDDPADATAGIARSACASTTNSNLGRFPWATLDTHDLRDASGARLWYALSDSVRYNPHLVPLNSDTPGSLTVDGAGDIVAVIIAPGAPVAGQPSRAAGPGMAAAFLEGDNATTGDNSFTRSPAGGNDLLVTISRADLMRAVEQRVLGEVVRALNRYRDTAAGAYPWLSPFANPSLSPFAAAAGTTEGHLAVHGAPGSSFAAGFQAAWLVPLEGALAKSGPQDLEPCARDSNVCPGLSGLLGGGDCRWQERDWFSCSASVSDGGVDYDYRIDIDLTGSTETATVLAATGADIRRRRYQLFGGDLPAGASASVTVTASDGSGAVLNLSGDDAGRNSVAALLLVAVPYYLDPERGELPRWLVDGQWHHTVLVKYASAYAPGTAANCNPAMPPCVTLRRQRPGAPPVDTGNHRGAVVIAGQDLAAARPSASISAYFEDENDQSATPGDVLVSAPLSTAFNDQLRSLGPP